MAIIAIDFDGTIVKHDFPNIGEPVPMALPVMRRLRAEGHSIILFTMRSKEPLREAIEYIENSGIQLFGVNSNPDQKEWTFSPKPYAHLYIDDAAAGCPLIYEEGLRPYTDWQRILKILLKLEYVHES